MITPEDRGAAEEMQANGWCLDEAFDLTYRRRGGVDIAWNPTSDDDIVDRTDQHGRWRLNRQGMMFDNLRQLYTWWLLHGDER